MARNAGCEFAPARHMATVRGGNAQNRRSTACGADAHLRTCQPACPRWRKTRAVAGSGNSQPAFLTKKVLFRPSRREKQGESGRSSTRQRAETRVVSSAGGASRRLHGRGCGWVDGWLQTQNRRQGVSPVACTSARVSAPPQRGAPSGATALCPQPPPALGRKRVAGQRALGAAPARVFGRQPSAGRRAPAPRVPRPPSPSGRCPA